MILRRLELDDDQRALCARMRDCVEQATGADPWLASDAEAAVLELSEALASGPSDLELVHWRRFFSNVLAITRRLDLMPHTPRQQLAMDHLVRLIDENRDLI
jgi:hypothetical protein